jgi:hypothetical protein
VITPAKVLIVIALKSRDSRKAVGSIVTEVWSPLYGPKVSDGSMEMPRRKNGGGITEKPTLFVDGAEISARSRILTVATFQANGNGEEVTTPEHLKISYSGDKLA